MSKVPDRFLGYAFCVGDVLLELNNQFQILNADGAVKSILGHIDKPLTDVVFTDLLSDSDTALLQSTVKNLNGSNRLGPVKLSIGSGGDHSETFAVFLSSLPMNDDRIYLVMSRPYRVGMNESSEEVLTDDDKKETFFNKMEELFEEDPEAADKLMVTVVEGASGNAGQQKEIERYLQSYSVGGGTAAKLADDKFAVVHEKDEEGKSQANIAADIQKATGVAITTASIDAKDANLSDKDSMRALAFSLQRFADGEEGFDAGSIEESCETLIGETTERVREFRAMMDESAFTLVYQPIVDFKTRNTHHFEALTRFHMTDVDYSPFEMITFAEDVGLIDEFDLAVIRRCLEKLKQMDRGVDSNLPKLAANVSGRSMSNPRFREVLLNLLLHHSKYKDHFSLEVTESAKITKLKELGDVLGKVRELGFKVYLDDFGAGASGFQYLRELEVDALKIDGAYVRDAVENATDRAFLRSMVTLCKELKITTVAEWVETAEQADLLRNMGVDYGQGYYFGKPNAGLITAKAT